MLVLVWVPTGMMTWGLSLPFWCEREDRVACLLFWEDGSMFCFFQARVAWFFDARTASRSFALETVPFFFWLEELGNCSMTLRWKKSSAAIATRAVPRLFNGSTILRKIGRKVLR